MEFRDKLFLALAVEPVATRESQPARDLANQVQQTAETCCEIWGHDDQPVFLSHAGAHTIATPTANHAHAKCRRCGRET